MSEGGAGLGMTRTFVQQLFDSMRHVCGERAVQLLHGRHIHLPSVR